jgi:hypothetical protein
MFSKSTLASVVLSASLLSLVSCGNDDSGKKLSVETNQQRQETQGLYTANLTSLNNSVAGTPSGLVTFGVEGDEVTATITVDGAPAQVIHRQSIRTGNGCPEASSDVNGDGFIDIMEAEAVSGKIFIPLDSDLNSHTGGSNYPVARSSGKYFYNESASLSSMIADIFAPSEGADSAIATLAAGEDLNFSGRTVMIQGVAMTNTLPETVATRDGLTTQATLPIACGVLTRIPNTDPIIVGNGGKE